jgi:hypothetical protein
LQQGTFFSNVPSFLVVKILFMPNLTRRFVPCAQILPKHFRHNKLTSFQRQLNLYGFQRIAKGTEAGRYYHALFDKNRPDKLSTIKRESRSSLTSGDDQGSDDDSETAPAIEPVAVVVSSAIGGRSGTRSGRVKKVVAGPEDHTAALAMINISRSLSSECLENEIAKCEWSLSPRESPGLQSSTSPSVKHVEFEHVLQQSLSRQSALEEEVVQLKLLVKSMMSRMENMTNIKAEQDHDGEGIFSIEPLTASSASSEDEDDKRPCESDDEYPAKRIKPSISSSSMSSFSVADSECSAQLVTSRDGLEQ